jgi:hypothetical protein
LRWAEFSWYGPDFVARRPVERNSDAKLHHQLLPGFLSPTGRWVGQALLQPALLREDLFAAPIAMARRMIRCANR